MRLFQVRIAHDIFFFRCDCLAVFEILVEQLRDVSVLVYAKLNALHRRCGYVTRTVHGVVLEWYIFRTMIEALILNH